MNLTIKKTLLALTFICISLVSLATDDKSERFFPSSESMIEILTNEVKLRVNLSEARLKVRESAIVVVQLIINQDGKVVINNKSANNPDFEDYVSDKLEDINVLFPEEYHGKALIYRFSLI